MSKPHTFFNVINFPEGKEDEAFAAWQAIGRFMETQKGFLGSTLYRNRRNPLMFINRGSYESEDSFLACVKSGEFQKLSAKLTELGVERIAGLYDELESFRGYDAAS